MDKSIPVPDAFFTKTLPVLADISQLKLLLCLFRMLERLEEKPGYFREEDILSDPLILKLFENQEHIKAALHELTTVNILISADDKETGTKYYLTQYTKITTEEASIPGPKVENEQPNIFKLYEENIGAITPMLAEILKEDEKTYPNTWIEEAIRIAVTRNARNWKYVQAILDRWQKEGRGNDKNRRDDSQDPESYRRSWLKDR